MHQKSTYDQLIRDAIEYRIVHDFAFGWIRFEWVYAFPYVTIVDRINQLYLEACEASERGYKNRPYDMRRDPFESVRGEVRFEYGTPYIANLIYHFAKYYEFKFDKCMKCEEHGSYCDMNRSDVRQCMEYAENKHWADMADPFGDD